MTFEEFDEIEYCPQWKEYTSGGITIQGSNFPYSNVCHISKEIPTSKLFVRIEKDSLERKIKFICE